MTERGLAILIAQDVLATPEMSGLWPLARDYLKALGEEDFVQGNPANLSLVHQIRAARVRQNGTA